MYIPSSSYLLKRRLAKYISYTTRIVFEDLYRVVQNRMQSMVSRFVVEENLDTSDAESKKTPRNKMASYIWYISKPYCRKNNLWADKPPQKKTLLEIASILIIMGNMNLTLTNVVLAHLT